MTFLSAIKTKRLVITLLLLLTILACNFPPLVNRQSSEEQPPIIVYVTATPEATSAPLVYEGEAPFDPNEMESLPESAPVQWNVRTTAFQPLLSSDVGSSGGTLTVSQPGGVLDGFSITVPAGAYESNVHFEIDAAEVTSITLPEGLELITPLISITNGEIEATKFLELRLPRQIAPGRFAMLFTMDADTGVLDALPLLEIAEDHLTALTTHFTLILGVEVNTAELDALNIQTGFKQGRNNWQFTNFGSFISPGGHCAGQSLMAMDFYMRNKGTALFGKYDNYNNEYAVNTPLQQDDDRQAYRLCSVAQETMGWVAKANNYWWQAQKVSSGFITYYSFALALRASGEPQLVVIYDSAGGGHAMIIYGKFADRLYVSDPNYPKADANRYIAFDRATKKFRPYSSGPTAALLGTPYPEIYYMNKFFLINDATAASLWAQLDAGTVGNSYFPAYKIQYSQIMADYSIIQHDINGTFLFVDPPEAVFFVDSTETLEVTVLDINKVQADQAPGGNPLTLPVIPGTGTPYLFDIYGNTAKGKRWIDGKWLVLQESMTGKWHGAACAESESNPYRWELTINQSFDGTISGDVYFHACPGGGATFYSLSGSQKPGEDFASLVGTKNGGRGDLGNNSSSQIMFTVRKNQPPSPNLAP